MSRGQVDFSRYLSGPAMASLGLVIGVGVWGPGALGAVITAAREDSALSLALAVVVFLPVVVCLLARALEPGRGATFYDVVRREGNGTLLFTAGWLSLGGYIVVAAIMVEALALRAEFVFEYIVPLDVPGPAVVLFTTLIVCLADTLVPGERPWLRNIIRWSAFLGIVGVIGWALVNPPPVDDSAILVDTPLRHWLGGVVLGSVGLWMVETMLDYRRQFRRSDRTLVWLVVLCWIVNGGMAALVGYLFQQHPDLSPRAQLVGGLVWQRDVIRVTGILVSVPVFFIVASRFLSRGVRLLSAMAFDGLLPSALERRTDGGRLPALLLLGLGLAVSLLGSFANPQWLVGIACVSLLWLAFLVIALGVRNPERRLESALRLPLHPTLPVLALALTGLASLRVPQPALPLTVVWLLAGALVFRGRSSQTLSTGDPSGEGDSATDEIPAASERRLLVCLGPASDDAALVRAGARYVRVNGGDLIILSVVPLAEQMPRHVLRRLAEQQLEHLEEHLDEWAPDVEAYPLVRIAPTVDDSLLDVSKRHQATTVLLDWPDEDAPNAAEHRQVVGRLLVSAAQRVAILRGELRSARRVLAAVSGGLDSDSVLQTAANLGRAIDVPVTALGLHRPLRAPDTVRLALDGQTAAVEGEITALVEASEDTRSGILAHADRETALVMGCTRNRAALAALGAGGLWADLVDEWPGPSLLVRRAEPRRARWVARLWDLLFLRMPTLSEKERAEVYSDMRHWAGASIDFYMLIIIASGIATFGLLQDSVAVIIGAMLVAPLMSPIVAIAQGIVQGNLRMIRRSLASTGKGAVTAVSVAAAFVAIVPDIPPTSQIMARTVPTLLDMAVGLAAGAAAAYGVSRKSVAAALPGVAISVALVPPLCVVGYGLGSDALDIALGALLLFLTNLSAIVFVSVVIFLLLGFSPRNRQKLPQVRTAVGLNVLVLLLLSVPLGISSCQTTREANLEKAVAEVLQRRADLRSLTLRNVDVDVVDGEFVVTAGVFADTLPTQSEVERLRDEVSQGTGLPVRLDLLMVRATRLSSGSAEPVGGFLEDFLDPEPGPASDPGPRAAVQEGTDDKPADGTPGEPAASPPDSTGEADDAGEPAAPAAPADDTAPPPDEDVVRDAQVDAFEQGFDAPPLEPLLDVTEDEPVQDPPPEPGPESPDGVLPGDESGG